MNKAQEIFSIAENLKGKVPNIRDLADQAIRSDWTVEYFREEAFARLPNLKPIQNQPLGDMGISPKDWSRYSISNAVLAQIPGSNADDGLEREFSQEISRRYGKSPEGRWIPPQVLTRNFVAGTGTLGGMIVSQPNLGAEFVDLLRNRAKVIQLGARVLQLPTPVTIPRQSGAGTVNWVGETVASTLSTGNFTQISLTPRGVSAFQQYSKQLLMSSSPDIDSLIRNDILKEINLAIDLAALSGTGGSQPTGLTGTTGINTITFNANGLSINNSSLYPMLVSMESEIATDNADVSTMGYLMRAGHRAACKNQSRFANTDTPIWTVENVNGELQGRVNSYRAEVSQQIATNLTTGSATTICSMIAMADWSQCIVAEFNGGAVDLVNDIYTLAHNGVCRILARKWVDFAVRQPSAVCLAGGILTT